MKDSQTESFHCTGVYATPEEIQRMKDEMLMPIVRIHGKWPEPEKVRHEIALSHGLPEIQGFYGVDFRDGEFLCLKEGVGSKPDKWEGSEEPIGS